MQMIVLSYFDFDFVKPLKTAHQLLCLQFGARFEPNVFLRIIIAVYYALPLTLMNQHTQCIFYFFLSFITMIHTNCLIGFIGCDVCIPTTESNLVIKVIRLARANIFDDCCVFIQSANQSCLRANVCISSVGSQINKAADLISFTLR